MEKQDIIKMCAEYCENSEDNIINEQIALTPAVAGLKIFEAPLVACGAADDEYFNIIKKEPLVIGSQFMTPREWLPGAQTVISIFLPFTREVKEGNKKDMSWPSDEWLHGRIEGQEYIDKICTYIKEELEKAGYKSIVPSLDERFSTRSGGSPLYYTSTWSERHAAYVCGLGTFGLSGGLITKKGTAGRLGSIITELRLEPDRREYEDVYEYCNMCGVCALNCPAGAISREKGKEHAPCSSFLRQTKARHMPRYGCGKCQIKVPCENGIPKRSK